jgi:hypothetical protein
VGAFSADTRFADHAVRVVASPKQRVTGSWAVVCHALDTSYYRDDDRFRGRTPLTVAMRSIEPEGTTCADTDVSGYARLTNRPDPGDRSGTVGAG